MPVTTFISEDYLLPSNEALLIACGAKKVSEKAPSARDRMTNIAVMDDEGCIIFDENDVEELGRVYDEKKSQNLI